MTEKEYSEISDKIHELGKEIERKKIQMKDLRREAIKYQQDKLSCLVGKAFKYNNKVQEKCFIISGVPEPCYMMTGECSFNPYQIPAVIASCAEKHNNTEVYVENDTVFSTACDSADAYKAFVSDKYTEISVDEFYDMVLKAVKTRVEAIDKGLRK